VTPHEIQAHIQQPGSVVIVLLDRSILRKDARDFVGHYVVILDFDSKTQTYTIVDPAPGAPSRETVCLELLEQARKAMGTDEDILFLDFAAQASAS